MHPDDIARFETLLARRDAAAIRESIPAPRRMPQTAGRFRSALMLSAHQIRHLAKIPDLTADAVIINLEDGVAPELKESARAMAARVIADLAPGVGPSLIVRVNPLDEGGTEDIALLATVAPDAIRIPKVTSPRDVERALTLIPAPIAVHLSIETREAFAAITPLRSDPRVAAMYLGILDLLASLDLPQALLHPGNPTIDHILARFLVETKTSGAYPVSFVYQQYQDLEGFERWCRHAKAMGFEGTGCISPKQADIANRIFGPSEEEIARARHLVERFEMMAAQGITGFADRVFGFIDEPIYKDAALLLARIS